MFIHYFVNHTNGALTNIYYSLIQLFLFSVIVLCMSVTDQARVLRFQRNSSHVIFTVNVSPFSTTHSLMGPQGATLHDVNQNDTSSPSILENVFIISALPSNLICNTTFGTCNKVKDTNKTHSVQNGFEVYEIYDSIALLSYAIQKAKQANENIFDSRIIKGHLRNITIDGYSGEIRLNSEGERVCDFILLDYHPDTKEFRSALTISRSANGQWKIVIGSPVLWPASGYVEPDPCYMHGANCEAASSTSLRNIIDIMKHRKHSIDIWFVEEVGRRFLYPKNNHD